MSMLSPLCLWLQFASSVWSWQFGWPSHTDTGSRQRPLSHMNSSLEQLSVKTHQRTWEQATRAQRVGFQLQTTTDCVRAVRSCTELWSRCRRCCHQSGKWPTLCCCLCWSLVVLRFHRTCRRELQAWAAAATWVWTLDPKFLKGFVSRTWVTFLECSC